MSAPGSATRVEVAPCGDRLRFDGDALVIEARTPIVGLEATLHRRPVLVIGAQRYTLLAVERADALISYRLQREAEALYELPGPPIDYDPERHVARRKDIARAGAGWLIHFATLPLVPFIGLLPEGAKHRLVALGINPTVSTGTSLAIEWFLCWPSVGIFLMTIIAQASLFTIALGAALPLTLIADLAWRWSGLQEDPPRHRGMFGVIPATVKGTIALVKDIRRPP
jgi:hypothetical protein